jgi:NAD(P)H-hydrate epimerase
VSDRSELQLGDAAAATVGQVEIPSVTVAQMREVDRVMTEEIGVDLVQMMENAGRALAHHSRTLLGGDVRGRRVTVLAGHGGNGGGGIAAARRLAIWGADVRILLAQPRATMKGVPLHQLEIARRIDIPISEPPHNASGLVSAEILLDALIGYSLRGTPSGAADRLIQAANDCARPIIALDVPSGIDADSGAPVGHAIRATSTLTLALPKVGLVRPRAGVFVGALYVADISVPATVYRRLGIAVGPIFAAADIVPVSIQEALS